MEVLKVKNRDYPEKNGTVGRYASTKFELQNRKIFFSAFAWLKQGGLLSSKDRWSNKISLDEVERILRDEGHEPMAQVQKDKGESDFIIQRRHTATPAHSQGLVTDLCKY